MKQIRYVLTELLILNLSTCFATEIPQTVINLFNIKDKNSDEYIFGASYASIDAKNAAIASLQGGDSTKALKILTAALEVMPHLDELRTLRNKSLDAVIEITKALELDPEKNCSVLLERYRYLQVVAPDSLLKLKNEKNCDKDPNKLARLDYNVFNIPPIQPVANLENLNKVDLTRSLDYYLNKNNNFPYDALVLNSFTYAHNKFASWKKDSTFEIQCQSLSVDSNATSLENILVTGDCDAKGRAEVINIEERYDEILRDHLEVPNGKEYVSQGKFYTSKPLKKIYEAGFEKGMIQEKLPRYYVMEMILRYKEKDERTPILVYYSDQLLLLATGGKVSFNDLMVENRLLYPFRPKGKTSFVFDSESLDGLLSISFLFDLKTTYDFYKKLFKNHTLSQIERSANCHSRDMVRHSECIMSARRPELLMEEWQKYIKSWKIDKAIKLNNVALQESPGKTKKSSVSSIDTCYKLNGLLDSYIGIEKEKSYEKLKNFYADEVDVGHSNIPKIITRDKFIEYMKFYWDAIKPDFKLQDGSVQISSQEYGCIVDFVTEEKSTGQDNSNIVGVCKNKYKFNKDFKIFSREVSCEMKNLVIGREG